MKLADTVIEKDWDRDKGFVCGCLHQLNKPFFFMLFAEKFCVLDLKKQQNEAFDLSLDRL